MELFNLLKPSEILVQIVNFLLVFFILKKFLWKHFIVFIDARRERIANEFKRIEEMKDEMARLKSGYEAQLAGIKHQATEQINRAIHEGRAITDEMKIKARQEAQDIVEVARKNIAHDIKKAQDEIRDKIVDLAIGAAQIVIREKLTAEQDRKIVEEFINNIDKDL